MSPIDLSLNLDKIFTAALGALYPGTPKPKKFKMRLTQFKKNVLEDYYIKIGKSMVSLGYPHPKIKDLVFIVNELVLNALNYGCYEEKDSIDVFVFVGMGATRIEVRQKKAFSESKFNLSEKLESLSKVIQNDPTRLSGRGLFFVSKKCNGELFLESDNLIVCNLFKSEDGVNKKNDVGISNAVEFEIKGALKGGLSDALFGNIRKSLESDPNLKILILNFSKAEFIDSKAIGLLSRINFLTNPNGVRVFLLSVSPDILDMLENSSILQFFHLAFSREEIIHEVEG